PEFVNGERRRGPERQRDGGRPEPRLDRQPQRRSDLAVLPGHGEPVHRESGWRPRLDAAGIEGVDHDDGERDIEECQHKPRHRPQQEPARAGSHVPPPSYSASNAPARFASHRYMAMIRTGTIANAAANGRSPDTPTFVEITFP